MKKQKKTIKPQDILILSQAEKILEYKKWDKEIPFIPIPKDWLIAPRPNFGGAVVRFKVTKRGLDDWVSVYLDCYDRLGVFGEPYWEIYPFKDDVYRVPMNNVNELVEKIEEALHDFETSRTK